MSRGDGSLRRSRHVRVEGVYLQGDHRDRARRGVERRRVNRWRAFCRGRGGCSERADRDARQQQVRRGAHGGIDGHIGRLVVDSFDEIDRIARLRGAFPPRTRFRSSSGSIRGSRPYPRFCRDRTPRFEVRLSARDRRGRAGDRSPAASAQCGCRRSARAHRQPDPPARLFRASRAIALRDDRKVRTRRVVRRRRTRGRVPHRRGRAVDRAVGGRGPLGCRTAGLPESIRASAEPGRSIVATSAITCYRVGTIKRLPEVRTYVAVDGGISDNPRPVLYGSGYEGVLPPRHRPAANVSMPRRRKALRVRRRPRFEARLPGDVVVGDVLATPVTGAYGMSMASNYNRLGRPAVVFCRRWRRPRRPSPGDARRPAEARSLIPNADCVAGPLASRYTDSTT